MSYKITEQARKRFKHYLIDQDLTLSTFAEKCGVKRQYLVRVLYGKSNVTPHVIEVFKKGGYELI